MQYLGTMGCVPCRSTVHEVKQEISARTKTVIGVID